MSIVYLSNRFPEPVESYVWEEIHQLRKQGCQVWSCSVQRPVNFFSPLPKLAADTLYVFPLRLWPTLEASWMCIWKFGLIADLVWRAVRGPEPISRRWRASLTPGWAHILRRSCRKSGFGTSMFTMGILRRGRAW